MTVEAPPRLFTTATGQRTWLIHGPDRVLDHADVWEAVKAGLSVDPRAPRIRSSGCTLTGSDLLSGVASFEMLPRESWIGVHVARSAAMVLAVLAIWSRGSTYLPLPTDLPAIRLAAMIGGCRPDAIITDTPNFAPEGYLPVHSMVVAGRTLSVLRQISEGEAESVRAIDRSCCYVTHTSGSTGVPKAVRISHRALINRLTAMRRLVQPVSSDKVLFKTSLSFDVHVWEFVLPLAAGCLLVIYDQGPFLDLRAIGRLIHDEGITIAGFVPSLLGALLDRPEFGKDSRLRVMFCGGETWTGGLARRFHQRLPACALRNSYGPAETTLAVANWLVPRDPMTRIQIGAPIENTVFMIDETSIEQGVVVGMLSVGGAPVADGYVSRAAADPFVDHVIDGREVRFYRTGDLVELHVDSGMLLFRGRADRQVKLNGVRIELGEVEAAIESIDAVEACAVVLLTSSSHPCLLATYKTTSSQFLDPASVRKRCVALLPSTHVPSYFREVDSYALTPSGKIDRSRIADVLARQA